MIKAVRLLALIFSFVSASVGADTIHACVDQTDLPPFSYTQRVDGKLTDHIVGASVDLLRQIGVARGWTVEVQSLPWARCLDMVAKNRLQLAINVDTADAQANKLRISAAYFTLHNVYFYSSKARPQGLTLTDLSELQNYRRCGFLGYHFDLFGVDGNQVDRGMSSGYEQMIAKLHLGRCDLFIDSRETMAGQYMINPKLRSLLVNGTLVIQPLPGQPLRSLHFAVSDSAPHSDQLLKTINTSLDNLDKTKTMDNLVNNYLK